MSTDGLGQPDGKKRGWGGSYRAEDSVELLENGLSHAIGKGISANDEVRHCQGQAAFPETLIPVPHQWQLDLRGSRGIADREADSVIYMQLKSGKRMTTLTLSVAEWPPDRQEDSESDDQRRTQ